MSKSPYELRSEMLHLAHIILSEQHRAKNAEKIWSKWEELQNSCEAGKSVDVSDFGPTTAPTTEELIAEAIKLNDFISTSNKK